MSGEMMLFPATVEEFMEQYKVVDRDHALSNGAEFVPVFRMRQWFDHLQAHTLTNADRIRAMTDEELAHLLHSAEEHLFTGNLWNYEKWTEWLKQEAANDNDDH